LKVKDRKLGDEWVGWDGKLSKTEVNVEAGKRLFLGFSLLGILIIAMSTMFVWYMIKPRIFQWSGGVADILEKVVFVIIGLLLIIFLQTVLSIVTRRNFNIKIGKRKISITFLVSFILTLGSKFNISYDRMGNSFIKVSNSLIRSKRWQTGKEKIVILLPRCLTRPIRDQIKSIAQKYQCLIYTVPGGELARKIISEQKPSAVIGVACERDLLAGIKDVKSIPVIAY